MAKFKRRDFSTCNAPHFGRPKTVTTPDVIDQIHDLILEDRRIPAKSIAEQLVISRDLVRPSFMKIWTCGNSPQSGSRNVRMQIKNVKGENRLNNFWNAFGTI